MQTLNIILATLSAAMLIEGLVIAIFPKSTIKELKRIFKNPKTAIKIGLIEIILALLVLFLISL
jgi:uncharacterized protein YjeT (DUF2065 family)